MINIEAGRISSIIEAADNEGIYIPVFVIIKIYQLPPIAGCV